MPNAMAMAASLARLKFTILGETAVGKPNAPHSGAGNIGNDCPPGRTEVIAACFIAGA